METWYAITNVGSTDTSVTINYFEKNGTAAGSETTVNLSTGEKASIYTCDGADIDFTGSAVLTANAQGAQIVALGKAQQQMTPTVPTVTVDFKTIFLGETAGASRLAFPYVRYANDNDYFNGDNYGSSQRSFMAVGNLESSEIKVHAWYYDKNGSYCGGEVLIIPENGKANTSALSAGVLADENGNVGICSGLKPGSFGYYQDSTFGGAVLLYRHNTNPNAKFIAINRTSHSPDGYSRAGEDVNGIPVP